MKVIKKIILALPWILSITAIVAAVSLAGYMGVARANREKELTELRTDNVNLQTRIESLREELASKYSGGSSQQWEMEFKAEKLQALLDSMPSDDPNAIDIMAKELFDFGSSLIEYMGDAEFRAHNFVEPEVEVEKNGYTYSKCDISYSDAIKFYSEFFTEKALNNFMSIRFTDINGDLYAIPGGGSSGFGIINVKLTRVYETEEEIKYDISYIHTFNGGYEAPGTCSMTIKLVNGSYKISEIDYMDKYWLSKELYWKHYTE